MLKRKNMESKKMIALLTLGMFILSYMAITPLVAPILAHYDGYSIGIGQLVVILVPICSVITMFLCVPLCKRFPMRTVSLLGLTLILFGSIPFFFSSFWVICLASILVGLGIGLVNVMSSLLVIYYFDGPKQIAVMGYQSIMVSIGGAFFAYASGMLATISFRYSYLCFLLALPAMFLLYYCLPKERIQRTSEDHFSVPFSICQLALLTTLFFIGLNVFHTSISVFTSELGLDRYVSGIATALYTLIGIVVGLFLKSIVGFLRKHVLTVACFIACLGLFILSFTHTIVGVVFASLMLGCAFAIRNPVGITLSANMVDKKNSVLAIALFHIFGQVGCFLSPYVIGIFLPFFENSVASMFFVASMMMLVVVFLHIFFNPLKDQNKTFEK